MIAAKTATLFMVTTAVVLLATGVARAADDEQALELPIGTLAHATEEIERATEGHVLEIRLVDEKGDPAFEAAVAQDDTVLYLRIASVTEVVTEIAVKELPPWLMNYRMQAYMRSISRAKVPLVEAIRKAEENAQAPAIGAGIAKPLSGDSAVLAYYVETIKGKARRLLAVDAERGAMIANPEAVYDHWTPVKLLRRLAP
jgi:uncharacterized membrane protein YkoI